MRDVIGNKAVQFRPYCGGVVTRTRNVITRTRNVSEDMLVPALCLVLTVYTEFRIVNKTGGILYCNANTVVWIMLLVALACRWVNEIVAWVLRQRIS